MWALGRMMKPRKRMKIPVSPNPTARIEHAVSAQEVSTITALEGL
jgi:hypothetical protein